MAEKSKLIRMDDNERQLFKSAARQKGMNVSAWIRYSLGRVARYELGARTPAPYEPQAEPVAMAKPIEPTPVPVTHTPAPPPAPSSTPQADVDEDTWTD